MQFILTDNRFLFSRHFASLFVAGGILLMLFFFFPAHAQSSLPELVFTWRAQSAVPEFYDGKALPTPGARVIVSLEVLQQGKRVSLAGETVYWYVDDTLVQNTPGAQTVSLRAGDVPGFVRIVRVQVEDFRGTGEVLVKAIRIPTVAPEVVIDSPFPKNAIASPSFTLRALPFFFNVTSPSLLSYAWEVDGETPIPNDPPSLVSVNVFNPRPGKTISARVQIEIPGNVETRASSETTFRFSQ